MNNSLYYLYIINQTSLMDKLNEYNDYMEKYIHSEIASADLREEARKETQRHQFELKRKEVNSFFIIFILKFLI
jgi:hypothetical protein